MINESLINPNQIVVVGGSNDVKKPGGKIIMNLLTGSYCGDILVVNPREKEVQGLKCFFSVNDISDTALEIVEMDINPLMDLSKKIVAVDARIKIKKQKNA